MLLCEPLDTAEKHRSRGFVLTNSAWVPVTHASVTPLRDVFQTDAARGRSHASDRQSRRRRVDAAVNPISLNAARHWCCRGESLWGQADTIA